MNNINNSSNNTKNIHNVNYLHNTNGKSMTVDLNKLKLAAVTVNQIPLAWDHNRDNILNAIDEARQRGIELLCFPELCISGYGCEDAFLAAATSRRALQVLTEILPATQGLAVALGLPLWHRNRLYNAVCFVSDTKIQGFVAKQNLAGYGVHYEPRWFSPWIGGKVEDFTIPKTETKLSEMKLPERSQKNSTDDSSCYPLGDQLFDWHGIKIGFEICQDAWVTDRIGISLAKRGVDLILNPSASHFAFGKLTSRKSFILAAAANFGVGYLYANLLGNEAGRIIYDGDTLIAAADAMLVSGPRFSFQDYVISSTTVDIQALRAYRAAMLDKNGTSDFYSAAKTIDYFKKGPDWENSPYLKEEEFTRSIALALFDYLRKSKSQGFVLNLSGGADSSACVCLVYYMVQLGIQSLGAREFQQKLSYIPAIAKLLSENKKVDEQSGKALNNKNDNKEDTGYTQQQSKKIMHNILFCLYQGTINNSTATKQLAKALCETLSVSFAEVTVDSLVKSYCELISDVLKQKLSWETDDIALQNIQARVRTPSIWLLANLRQAIVICASNRSEASVGYCTIDGDTAGGISPIAGVDKNFVLQWLKWLADIGPIGMSPLSILKDILALEPSAELRPLANKQKDEEDLMPYSWLAIIEQAFLRDRLSAAEILLLLKQKFPKENSKKLELAVEKFLKLWTSNQWKRERLAPSFYVDDASVDPKTWCRYPILSGGY